MTHAHPRTHLLLHLLQDFDYVARSYVVTLVSISGYFYLCRAQGWGLEGVWWGVVLFFAVR